MAIKLKIIIFLLNEYNCCHSKQITWENFLSGRHTFYKFTNCLSKILGIWKQFFSKIYKLVTPKIFYLNIKKQNWLQDYISFNSFEILNSKSHTFKTVEHIL